MRLADLHGEYDAIFSLGQNCLPTMQLQKNGLRRFAGVLDWMMSDTLSDVNRLLANRFEGFMEFPNLSATVNPGNPESLMVTDHAYHIISVHDFDTRLNTVDCLAAFPLVKEKYERRIRRFLDQCANGKRILFVRMHGTLPEATELQHVLSTLVAHEFSILVTNYTQVSGVIEVDWGLEKVCAIEIPSADVWNYRSDPHWQLMFSGLKHL